MNNEQVKYAEDLCTLIRCALNAQKPRCENMDLPKIHDLAKKHSLSAIFFMAVEGTEAKEFTDPKLFSAWQQEKEML